MRRKTNTYWVVKNDRDGKVLGIYKEVSCSENEIEGDNIVMLSVEECPDQVLKKIIYNAVVGKKDRNITSKTLEFFLRAYRRLRKR